MPSSDRGALHDFGPLAWDLIPLIEAVRSLPRDAWIERTDPESDKTRVVRENSPHFPRDLASPVLEAASGQYLGPGFTNRVVLSCVPAGEQILPHWDDFGETVRAASQHCHIPLISAPSAVMRFPDLGIEQYMETGHLYAMDERQVHAVTNPSGIDRIHLLFAHFPH